MKSKCAKIAEKEIMEAIKKYMVIDEGIKPLVEAIQALGYTTVTSCEGHPVESKKPWSLPEVCISSPDGSEIVDAIMQISGIWDRFMRKLVKKEKGAGWNYRIMLTPMFIANQKDAYLTIYIYHRELKQAQEMSKRFADYIKKNIKRSLSSL